MKILQVLVSICFTIFFSNVEGSWLTNYNYTTSEEPKQGMGRLSCTTNVTAAPNLISRSGIIFPSSRWAHMRVFIDPVFNNRERRVITQAVNTFANAFPCVRFEVLQPWARPDGDYVHVVGGQVGCRSFVGKFGGRQQLFLERPGCVDEAVILHEFGHALGLGHEHQRADRDNHVNIHYNNIEADAHRWFEKLDSSYSDFGVPYNVRSIMHYYSLAFSWNGRPTITTKNGGTIQYARQLQNTDIRKLRIMYNC